MARNPKTFYADDEAKYCNSQINFQPKKHQIDFMSCYVVTEFLFK